MVKIKTLRDLDSMFDMYPGMITYNVLDSNEAGTITCDFKKDSIYEQLESIRSFFAKNAEREINSFTIDGLSLGFKLGITFES